MSLIVLKRKECVTKQCAENVQFLITTLPNKCATRQCATTQQYFFLIPNRFKTQEMCIKVVEVDLWQLEHTPDLFKTQGICNKAVRDYLFSLHFVLDQFVTQQQIDIWYGDDNVYNDNDMIKWYHEYQKRKAQKAKRKYDLVPIAWYPDRVMDWCMSEDEKSWWK